MPIAITPSLVPSLLAPSHIKQNTNRQQFKETHLILLSNCKNKCNNVINYCLS